MIMPRVWTMNMSDYNNIIIILQLGIKMHTYILLYYITYTFFITLSCEWLLIILTRNGTIYF